ncbi:peptide deformylase [Heyndrickxia sporothermodurans]|uniref:Peptide deformylase n=1 Tax=Heyndrickxia sporothermodurans TaxID=46224 RepID=A0A150L7C5_9BACI|nr:peptide deformylase [Heyndrickxia sporothermodurans]KYD08198.1 Peptide deformylase [Heyndrickxia sporothermodurans]MEB6548140.1 peptide deformylase [Heyndrickxia sporothermodurans]MED3650034.1 peptide deformylase [Heyndrickxia sporothermodurans]MED3655449.1 peptide deformylase [Heyndrickxia sporothermodurans]MED3698020.1 peptide deformylase [Heyndrickxia sporothermodurans]
MAILTIVKHPADILEKECELVTQFDKKLKVLLNDMYETMLSADGVGLAAPQIGIDQQIAVVDIGDDTGRLNLINPVIIEKSGEQTDVEGCLSFPGLYGTVSRPFYVKVQAQDVKGRTFYIEAEDYLARAIQHEIDHLHGVLFTTKVLKYIDEEELEGYEEE